VGWTSFVASHPCGRKNRKDGAPASILDYFALAGWFGEGFVDELVELGAVDYFNEGRAFGVVGGDDPYGGGVLDADALAEGVVGLTSARSLPWGSSAKGREMWWSVANLAVNVARTQG